jgi:16S rRNA (uracil1498-N3)-methyltransferase
MIRRVHVQQLKTGTIALDPAEAHHIRDVLRLDAGSPLELFDDAGNVAEGVIRHVTSGNVVVDVEAIRSAAVSTSPIVTVAAAVPKGDRADWMVEKLTELGVARFIPLATERSVVLPSGKNKIERWERIAIESAKQSRRVGIMAISTLTPLHDLIAQTAGIYLSTQADAIPMSRAIELHAKNQITLLIGPEGGWSDGEIERMNAAAFVGARLTSTILRVETAAVVAAGVVMCVVGK